MIIITFYSDKSILLIAIVIAEKRYFQYSVHQKYKNKKKY